MPVGSVCYGNSELGGGNVLVMAGRGGIALTGRGQRGGPPVQFGRPVCPSGVLAVVGPPVPESGETRH